MKGKDKYNYGTAKTEFQRFLRTNNFTDSSGKAVAIDGTFGRKTGEAVENFQKEVGLKPTGIIDNETIKAMNSFKPAEKSVSEGLNLPSIKEGAYNPKIGMYQATIPEMEIVGKRGLNKNVKLFDYNAPQSIEKIKEFQRENNLPPTGVFDKKTHDAFYKTETEKERKNVLPRYNKGVRKRNDYKAQVKREASRIQSGDNFGMDKTIKESLKKSGVDKIGECIGGVCNFLDNKVEKGLFKGGYTDGGFMEGHYFSNSSFEEASRKEGWQRHDNFNYTTPDIGDIVRVNYIQERGRNHAMLVVDKNPDANTITILDNEGDDKARKRTFTLDEFQEKFNNNKMKTSFYRRTNFGDIDIAEESRYLKNRYKGVPEELQPEKRKEPLGAQLDLNIKYDKKTKAYDKYVEGIESVDLDQYPDIPEEDIKKLGVISASIPYGESELGRGLSYKMESGFRSGARQFRKWKSGTPFSKTLSVGLSQINPQSLNERIKKKYFKGLSDIEIEKKLNKDKELQGKVSFDIMVDRYRRYRDSAGSLYGDDPEKFWYALTNSWQNPNKIKKEGAKEDLNKFNWDYVNNILGFVDKVDIQMKKKDKQQYSLGGKLLQTGLQIGGNMLLPGLGTAASAVAGSVMDDINRGKVMNDNMNRLNANTNPYQFKNGGTISGAQDNFKLGGPSHEQGGIPINNSGLPTMSMNTDKEAEGQEVVIKMKGKPSYVLSKTLKI